MIEPPDGGQTWPSGLWSLAEVVNYLNQRQNLFLKYTQLQFGMANIPAVNGTATYDLPDDWITTVRVVWVALDGSTRELGKSDYWEADNGIPSWTQTDGTPLLYYDGGKPITITVMPAPDADGTIFIEYVPYAALLDGTGEIMTLPDEFVPSIKYGVMADMLTKVARSQDPRADYCNQRFQLGIELARLLVGGFA
jgi:hypothetical protein